MSCRRRVWAAVRSAAALCFYCVCVPLGPAHANDSDDPRVMLFSGRDIWRNGAFAHGGFVIAPSGLDQDGLLLKIMLSGGLYRYDAQNLGERIVGASGWRKCCQAGGSNAAMSSSRSSSGPKFKITICRRTIRPIDCAATHPACASLPKFGTSQPRHDDRSRRFTVVDRDQQLGPRLPMAGACSKRCLRSISDRKLNTSARDGYRHGRLGMHITSMKTEDTEWSAAAGWARDSDRTRRAPMCA